MAKHPHRGHNRNPNGRSDPVSNADGGSSIGTAGSNIGPGAVHEAFLARIQTMIDDAVADQAITTGTVTGKDGGRVSVLFDHEDEPRAIGFPKKKGTRYQPNERVLVGKTRGGRHVVLGTYTDKQGDDEVSVDSEDLYPDAITNRELSQNSVMGYNINDGQIDSGHIAGGQIGSGHLGAGAVLSDKIGDKQVTNAKLAKDAVTEGEIKDNSIKNSHLQGNAVSKNNLDNGLQNSIGKAESALQKGDLPDLGDYAKKGDLGDYAKKTDLAKGAVGTKELADKDWVTKNFQKKGSSSA